MLLLGLLIPLGVVTAIYLTALTRAALAARVPPRAEALVVSLVANFFDTLGIGSFAPTMAWFRLRRLIEDRQIPCTMLVGYTAPSIVQAVIFLVILGVFVDPALLAGCAVALLVGALIGAPLVTRTRVWIVQLIVGVALLMAALFYALTNLNLMPGGGTATSLPLPLMVGAIAANFVFGVLVNFGVGNYAPTLALLSLMGMDPRYCFPIMAGGAALAGGAASVRHIAIREIDLRVALGLAIGGIPAVLVAAFVVKSMPIELLRWLVTVVVIFAGFVMLRSAAANVRAADTAVVGSP